MSNHEPTALAPTGAGLAIGLAIGVAIGIVAIGLVVMWPAHTALLLLIVAIVTAR